VGGVADYTAILSRRLVEVSNGAVAPVLVHAGRQPADAIEVDVPVVDLSGQCSAVALAETIERLAEEAEARAVVLLEYSGYGYAKRGAPLWLARGLRRACTDRNLPLITIFHELYAESYKPWDRRFWTMPVQYYVASRLARLSDGCMATWDAAARWLERRVDGQPIRMSPTFSNVGEPESVPAYSERKPYAVCFGGAGRKEALYRGHGNVVCNVLRRLGIEQIVDLGSEPADEAYAGMDVPVEPKGIQPVETISAYLKKASVGLLNHPLHCLKKSGIWASYAVHGVPAMLSAPPYRIPNLRENDHFLLLQSGEVKQAYLDSISHDVQAWYREIASSELAARRVLSILSDLQ
jgi:hypothetical protein